MYICCSKCYTLHVVSVTLAMTASSVTEFPTSSPCGIAHSDLRHSETATWREIRWVRRGEERGTWPGSEHWAGPQPHTWSEWAGRGQITLHPTPASQHQLHHHSFSTRESLTNWAPGVRCEVTREDTCDICDSGQQHGAPHRRWPRGLHPHGQDQHGGVH